MTEIEILKHAKKYIDSLANGIDPLSGNPVNENDIVNNIRISRCFFYVSGVLQKVIDNGGEVQREKLKRSARAEFELTDEQKQQLVPEEEFPLSSAKIASAINSLIDDYTMKKLKAATLNNWLVSVGMLKEIHNINGKTRKVPTEEGKELGISERSFTNESGLTTKYAVYDKNAQQFIYDNIDALIEFAHDENSEKNSEKNSDIDAE